jgi:hypothetical protein
MPFQEQWKAAKTKFAAATGKKKPSEKFMGFYRKSSGVEGALKKIDAAIAKKLPNELATALEEYRKTHATYYATMHKAAKAEPGDENYLSELTKLNLALNQIYREADEAGKALEKDPKVLVSVEDAIGPNAVGALGRSQVLTHAALLKWLNAADAGIIVLEGDIGPQKTPDPESKAAHEKTKKLHEQVKKLYAGFTAALPKVMERGKAWALAEGFVAKLNDLVLGMDEGSLQGGIGNWMAEQRAAFEDRSGLPNAEAKKEMAEWVAKSSAWKAAQQVSAGLWGNETTIQSDFRRAVRARQ